MARLLEDVLRLKLGGAGEQGPQTELAGHLSDLVDALSLKSILIMLELALRAATAVDAMANSRLQAEGLWIAAGEAVRTGNS